MNYLPEKIEELVLLHEKRYPERERRFDYFFRRTDKCFFQHMINIKYMVYLLDEEILVKMLELMQPSRGIYIQLFSEKNPKKNGASAYFGRDFWGKARIRYYEIDKKRQLNPPYKTFFHEFGHALDDLSKKGRKFCSDGFTFTQEAKKNCLAYERGKGIYVDKVSVTETRTIHEWAVFDVENYLIQTAANLLPTVSAPVQTENKRVIDFVVYHLFLCPDGAEKREALAENKDVCAEEIQAIQTLYQDIQRETEQKTLRNIQDTIVLPKDLFGGVTNNQLGGGHEKTYWFAKKRRIREVSREAFAGYFEYRATISDPAFREMVINPYNCIPYTKFALEGMLKEIL